MTTPEILKKRARTLRNQHTPAEKFLWKHLRGRRFENYKFRRQYPIGNYIVDFICIHKKFIIEADGSQHAEQVVYDSKRTVYLEEKGFRVLRFWNHEILTESEMVLDNIWDGLHSPSPSLFPSPAIEVDVFVDIVGGRGDSNSGK